MNPQSSFDRCKNITETLKNQSLNQFFVFPVDPENDGLIDYFDIIANPMDLTTVQNKLNDNKYENEYKWYKDVCLIYENAMKYHKPGNVYHSIAQYCLKSFKKITFGIEYTSGTTQDWYDAVCKQTQKLSTLFRQNPINKIIDPQVLSIIEKCKTMDPVPLSSVDEITNQLNDLMRKETHRFNIISIFNELQPSIDVDVDDLKIPVSELGQQTLNAIYLYSQSI